MRFLLSGRPARMRFQLAAFSATRTVLNSGFRLVYPFLPVIARGLGVDLQTMALAVTARSALGVTSPFLGSFADLRGRKLAMIVGLLLFGGAFLLVPLRPVYWVVLASLLLSMLGKLLFDPAMQAYLGDQVSYARRGLAIAITEIGWSASSLIGIPLIGWLMSRQGWAAPFPWLAIMALGAAILLWRTLPADPPRDAQANTLRQNFGLLLRHPAALAGLAVGVLTVTGNETVNIMYGAWLEGAFGLQVAALGGATIVLGLAELGGEGAVAGLSDRFGKKRIVALAILLNAAASMALLLLGGRLEGALLGLFLFYLTFEVVVVGSIPLMTQVLPAARATVMASNAAGLSLGRALGAAIGPMLYSSGLVGNTLTAAGLDLVALLLLLAFVRVDEEDAR